MRLLKYFFRNTLFFFLTALFIPVTATAETITLAADRWPPFNLSPNSEFEGYMVDVARYIFEKKGYTVQYVEVPWKRAVSDTERGIYSAIIGASKQDAAGFVFPEEELARNILAFYVRKDDPWRFAGVNSLSAVTLGVIGGYDYRQWLNTYIEANQERKKRVQVITGDKPLQRNLLKLEQGRVDLVVDNDAAIRWEAMQMGLLGRITHAGSGTEPAYCYIAFSPALENSGKYAQILSEGIVELRKNRQLTKILDKYGVKDWKKGLN